MDKKRNNKAQRLQAKIEPSSKAMLYLLLSAVFISLSACGGSGNSTPTTPTITEFIASATTVTAGEEITLSWKVAGTQPLSLSITGIGDVTGTSTSFSPTQTTSVTLTATNATGTDSKELTITVNPATTDPLVDSKPTIVSFTASPATITSGESSTIRWNVTGTAPLSLFITGSSGATDELTGTSRTISPTQTSTFTLTAKNSFGETSKELTITVDAAPVNPTPPVNQCQGQDINIPDDVLEAALRAEDTIPDSGPITCTDMETLTSFEYEGSSNTQITDITGLNFATSLERLELEDNAITTIKRGVFNGMTSLTELYLSENAITTIENNAFSDLTNLALLALNDNAISNIPSGNFSGLTSLTDLNLSRNAITSIESGDFSGLNSLAKLRLGLNNITSIESSDFSGLNSLTTLRLGFNNITSIESGDFSGLDRLETLRLNGNAITKIDSGDFSGLPSLTTLDLSENAITTIESGDFSGLTTLQSLSLAENAITTIENGDFDGLTNLQSLSFYDSSITSIENGALSSLLKLDTIFLSYNGLTDITAIKELAHKNVSPLTRFDILSNCLSEKVPTRGILAGIESNTSDSFNNSSNPKTSGTPACPNPLPAQAASVSNFDLDPNIYEATEAWSITGNGSSTEAEHIDSNGQSAGFIKGTDAFLGETWYFKAPQQYYGDASDYKDGFLTYHLNQLTSGLGRTSVEDDDIILEGGGITLSFRFDAPNPSEETWKPYNVQLSATGWINKNNNTTATSADMDTVLANLSSLEIRGDYVGGADVGLDSVVMERIVRF